MLMDLDFADNIAALDSAWRGTMKDLKSETLANVGLAKARK